MDRQIREGGADLFLDDEGFLKGLGLVVVPSAATQSEARPHLAPGQARIPARQESSALCSERLRQVRFGRGGEEEERR